MTEDLADALGLPNRQGALVTRVTPDGPADQTGVQAGDIVLRFNGRAVERVTDLPRLVGQTQPGTRATLSVWRKGKALDMPVTLADTSGQPRRQERGAAMSDAMLPRRIPNQLGIAVSDLSAAQRRALGLASSVGVRIDGADGPVARAGLRGGDVLLRVSDTDIASAREFDALVSQLDPHKTVALLVRRGDDTQFVPLRPGRDAPSDQD